MGSCLNSCCLSQTGTICCSIISLLGTIYFLLTWLIFEMQYPFYEFHIPDKDGIQNSTLIAAIIYFLFFIWAWLRLRQINNSKTANQHQKIKKSISQLNSIQQVYQQDNKITEKHSERQQLLKQT